MQSADRLAMGGKHQRRPLRAPDIPPEQNRGERHEIKTSRGGGEGLHQIRFNFIAIAQSTSTNCNVGSSRKREVYSIIETVMGFVRSTCQGQVKMALVREEGEDGRAEKRPIGVRIPVRRDPRPCQAHLITNCASPQTSNANRSHTDSADWRVLTS